MLLTCEDLNGIHKSWLKFDSYQTTPRNNAKNVIYVLLSYSTRNSKKESRFY